MSAIKDAFYNTISFQQELMELDGLDVPEELGNVMLRMLDRIETLELKKTLLENGCGSVFNYEAVFSEKVRESWEDDKMKGVIF